MKKLLFFSFILYSFFYGCSDKIWKNEQQQNRKLSPRTNNIKDQPTQKPKAELLPALVSPFEVAEKSVWKIKNKLILSTNRLSIKQNQNNKQLETEVKNKVQQISLAEGTGFFISPNHIITNFHVIHDILDEDIEVIAQKQIKHTNRFKKLKLLKVSAVYDLALLESEETVKHYLNIEQEADPYQTDHFLIAYIKKGLIRIPLKYTNTPFKELTQFTRDTSWGSLKGTSGGAVINEKGNIVGVNHAGSDNLSSVVSIQALNDFLNQNHRDCSQIQKAVCIEKEMLFLEKMSKKEDKMAQYMDEAIDYSPFLKKKQILVQLIEDKTQLQSIEIELQKAVEDFNKNQKEEESIYLNKLIDDYKLAINKFNQSVDLFNNLKTL